MPHDVGFLVCQDDTCDESVPNHKWGKVKTEGWLFSKDDKAWCPAHLPEWYADWKAGTQKQKPRERKWTHTDPMHQAEHGTCRTGCKVCNNMKEKADA